MQDTHKGFNTNFMIKYVGVRTVVRLCAIYTGGRCAIGIVMYGATAHWIYFQNYNYKVGDEIVGWWNS